MTAETTLPVVSMISKFEPHSLHTLELQAKSDVKYSGN